MKTLGIDYGRHKIGLALGQGNFAEPWKVIYVRDFSDAVKKIKKIARDEAIEKIVVGVSEGEMAKESKKFADELEALTFDETLTSHDAQKQSIKAGVPRQKRHKMEDAYAASIILQNFLDFPKDLNRGHL